MNRQRIVITVDGLAGSGKTTLSQALAARLGFVHLNSGLLYRAIALLTLRQGISPDAGREAAELVSRHKIELALDDKLSSRVLIDGLDVSGELQGPRVSQATSVAAAKAEVRAALINTQRNAFAGKNMVAEGRDMGTVVFPEAKLKFFVQASPEVRAARRLKQLKEVAISRGEGASETDLNVLKRNMEIEIYERDRRDASRLVSPVYAAPGAIIIDNSEQTLTEVVESMYDAVLKRNLV